VRKWLSFIGLATLAQAAQAFAFLPLPENASAFGNCTATVKVSAARLRQEPSLESRIVGVKLQEEAVYVTRVQGKWVQVVTGSGDTAYMAAYLLNFPYHDLLEQWKRETPSPSVGKKAKVKWARVNFRKYPSRTASPLGTFARGDEVAVLSDLGTGWSLVESRTEGGQPGCYGFIANGALSAPDLPDPPDWVAPLARLRKVPGRSVEPSIESPSEYLARTAWSPGVFLAEHKADKAFLTRPGDLLASR
jgi:hypothetical protein